MYIEDDKIPDKKERLTFEMYELLRRSCNYQTAIHTLRLSNLPQKIVTISIIELERERDSLLEDAIQVYEEMKNVV